MIMIFNTRLLLDAGYCLGVSPLSSVIELTYLGGSMKSNQ